MSDIIKNILIAMLLIFVIGLVGWLAATVVDRFTYITDGIPVDDGGERTYTEMQSVIPRIFGYVYTVPILFMIVVIIWAFKATIKKHLYGKQDGLGEDEYY